MGFPKGASIPFGQGRGQYPGREVASFIMTRAKNGSSNGGVESSSAMSANQNTATTEDIQKIVQQIVARFRPRKVILFGSYAHGKPTRDSDVDLLVVMETDEQVIHAAARISATIDHPFPLDILVVKPSELKAFLERKGVFATEVMAKGIVLHEA